MDIVVFLALWALIFTLPWEANYEVQGFLPGFETGTRLMGAVTFLLGIFTMLVTFSMRRLPRAFIPLGLFVAWSFVGMFWSLDPEVTQTMSVTFLLLLTLVWLIWQYADSVPRQEWLMRAFVCGMVIALLDMYYNIARGVDPLGGTKMLRYASTGANPNGMGMCLVIAINFAYYLVTRPGRKAGILLKFAYWGFMLAAAVAVFWTGSRSAVLDLAIWLLLTVTTVFRVGWKPAVVLVLCLGAAVYIIPRVVPAGLLTRVQEGTHAGTFQERIDLWEQSFQAWVKNPILGIGSGATSTSGGAENVSHNTFLTVVTENGLIGVAVYTAIWLLLLADIRSMPKIDRTFWIIMIASNLPSVMSASLEYSKTLWFIWAMVFAQSAALRANPSALARPLPGRVAFQPPYTFSKVPKR